MAGSVGFNVRASEVARKAKPRGWRIVGGATLLAVAGLVGSNAWVAWASRGCAYESAESVPARSVAIVPGSRVHEGKPLFIVRCRLQAGLDLYRAGGVKAIVVSGNDSAANPEVTVMRAWLRARGVPAAEVWSDAGG